MDDGRHPALRLCSNIRSMSRQQLITLKAPPKTPDYGVRCLVGFMVGVMVGFKPSPPPIAKPHKHRASQRFGGGGGVKTASERKSGFMNSATTL